MTKSNHCPGSKSNVEFDKLAGKPVAGCIEQNTIDQDPRAHGLQADCTVTDNGKPITNVCVEVVGHSGPHEKNKYPCWRPSYQPAVCPDLTTAVDRGNGKPARPQVGIIVIYGDHEVRGKDVKIKAECKAAPPVQAPADPLAEPVHK
jgi:hypothetical protein